MIALRKAVYRIVASDGRDLVVGIEPPGLLTFREKGTRRTYTLGLRALFVRAVMDYVEAERLTKRRRPRNATSLRATRTTGRRTRTTK